MSHSSEMWAEQQELSEQAEQSEAELFYAIMDALQTAKNIGLNQDHLKTLCYVAGVDLESLT
jgi:hypothetical protein